MAERPRNQRVPSAPEKSVEQRTIRELMRDPTYGMPMSAEGQPWQARAEKRRKRTGETNQTTTFVLDGRRILRAANVDGLIRKSTHRTRKLTIRALWLRRSAFLLLRRSDDVGGCRSGQSVGG
eukprot:765738-Hanusia_phi.AAC.6